MAYVSQGIMVRIQDDTELIKIGPDKYKYINKNFKKISEKMYDYHCDIRLLVGTQNFRAHKSVLTEASEYFAAMFGHDMMERDQGCIEIHEISPEGFAIMINYFYHGHVTASSAVIDDILEAARFFHIEWLICICCDFLIRYLSIEHYNYVIELADKYSLGDLRDEIFQFISLNFFKLAEELSNISFEILHMLLSENHYIEASENEVLHTVLRWLESDKERMKHAGDILQHIRFSLLDIDSLRKLPKYVTSTDGLKKLVDEALSYQLNVTAQCLHQTEQTQARGAVDTIAVVSAKDDAKEFHYKIPAQPGFLNESTDTAFMASVFEFSSVTVLGNFLYVAGGYDRRKWCSSPAFYCYNPRNRAWVQLTSMQQPRVSFALATDPLRGLYAVAGIEHRVEALHDSEDYLSSVEFYDPSQNSWQLMPPMPLACFSCAATVAENENLYVCGGISADPEDNIPVAYLHSYHPNFQDWCMLQPMLTARQGHALAASNNKLFVFGGYTEGVNLMSFESCLACESYDIETNQWSQIQNIPPTLGHIHPTCAVLNGEIYILSGDIHYADRFLHRYNPENDELTDGEVCGVCVRHVFALKVAFPKFFVEDGELSVE